MDKLEKHNYVILGLIGLIIFTIVVGATYAYFAVGTTNNFGTQTISVEADDVGSVLLTKLQNNLSLNLSASDMMDKGSDVNYCASSTGTEVCSEYSSGWKTVAKIDLTGTGVYKCDYTLNITATGTNNMYTRFQNMPNYDTAYANESNAYKSEGQLKLYILGGIVDNNSVNRTYDFNTANLFPITEEGSLYISSDINASEPVYSDYRELMNFISSNNLTGTNAKIYEGGHVLKTIEVGLLLVNDHDIDQTALAGTDLTLTISIPNFSCIAISNDEANTLINALLES